MVLAELVLIISDTSESRAEKFWYFISCCYDHLTRKYTNLQVTAPQLQQFGQLLIRVSSFPLKSGKKHSCPAKLELSKSNTLTARTPPLPVSSYWPSTIVLEIKYLWTDHLPARRMIYFYFF